MAERQQFEEVSNVVAMGLLAEDIVLVVGRVLRDPQAELRDRDRRVVADARRLFQILSEQSALPVRAEQERLVVDDAYLDAMRIVRERVVTIEKGEREAASQLVNLLDAVLNDAVMESHQDALRQLRETFVEVGKTMLMRSSELMRSRQETMGAWRPLQTTSPS